MSIIEKYDAIIEWINLNRSGFKTQTEVIEAIRKCSRIEGYIRELSLILFQHTLGTCGNCLADAMIAIRKYPRAKLEQIMNCKFKLKSGALLIDATGRLPENSLQRMKMPKAMVVSVMALTKPKAKKAKAAKKAIPLMKKAKTQTETLLPKKTKRTNQRSKRA